MTSETDILEPEKQKRLPLRESFKTRYTRRIPDGRGVGRLSWKEYDILDIMIRDGHKQFDQSYIVTICRKVFDENVQEDSIRRFVKRMGEFGILKSSLPAGAKNRAVGYIYSITMEGLNAFFEADAILLSSNTQE